MAHNQNDKGLTIDQKRILLEDHALEVVRLAKEIEAETGGDQRQRIGTQTLIRATRALLRHLGGDG